MVPKIYRDLSALEINDWVRFPFQIICRSCFDIVMLSILFILTKENQKSNGILKIFGSDRIPKWTGYPVNVIVSITSPRERNRLFVLQPSSPLT